MYGISQNPDTNGYILVHNNSVNLNWTSGNEEIDDIIMEPPELNIDDDDIDEESDNESDNGNNNETDEFIKLWFERLNEEDTNVDDISDDEIDEDSSELNELLRRRIHPADNDDAKWDLTTLFKSQRLVPTLSRCKTRKNPLPSAEYSTFTTGQFSTSKWLYGKRQEWASLH